MKYKKLLVLITCLLFVTVAVFCFASAFKVTDIDLHVTTVQGSSEDVKDACAKYLSQYENKNLTFVKKDKIERDLSSLSGYIEVVSVKKEFPNKISVNVREKAENLVIYNGENYYSLDLDFCVLAKKQGVENNLKNGNNLLIKLDYSDYLSDVEVGKPLKIYDGKLLEMMKASAPIVNNFKGSLSFVSFTAKTEGHDSKTITLNMKEGCTFKILKADVETELKLNATYEFYLALENKGVGDYVAVLGDDGNISIRQ